MIMAVVAVRPVHVAVVVMIMAVVAIGTMHVRLGGGRQTV